ncbi:MAG: RNA polymerase sigma factor [Cyclonatronaceae bacterium]
MKKACKDRLFEELIAKNEDRIYRICRSYLTSKSDIPDLYQEILLEIWKSIDRFRHEAAWSTYIYRIALNTAIKFTKKAEKNREQALPVIEIEDNSQKSEDLEKEQTLHVMHSCIQMLSDSDKLLITLVLEDLSYKEIAEILDCSTNLIGVRIKRVKGRLLKLMENHYESI